MPRPVPVPIVAAIDLGTNAVRLEIARRLPDGSLETLHQERDPVRPGEGVFKHGVIPREVANRLMSTLRRYAALCRRYGAQVRAVATSAMREARNRDELVRRAKREAGLRLEVVSGMEEARLICLGVLHGKPPGTRSLCVDIGGGSTEVSTALGDRPTQLWSVALGAVRLTELFDTSERVSTKQLKLLRSYAREALKERIPGKIPRLPRVALGSSGTINAVIAFASEGEGRASARQITRAVETLAEMSAGERRKRFDPRRAEIVVAGGVILEAVVSHLGLEAVAAVQRGLRDGILIDFFRRQQDRRDDDPSLLDGALTLLDRFEGDRGHASHVARLALQLFDDLARLHRLPASTRPLLEIAALLHDVGNTVSFQRHHKHSQYVIENADLPGLGERDRALVARLARFHRRSFPEAGHPGVEGVPASDLRTLRRLAVLLRVANALDRGHRQEVVRVRARQLRGAVVLRLRAKTPVDLEVWHAEHEAAHFRKVLGRGLSFQVERSRS